MTIARTAATPKDRSLIARTFPAVLAVVLVLFAAPPGSLAQTVGATPERPGAAQETVNDILIEIHDYPGPRRGHLILARDLILLQEGRPFSKSLMDRSVSILKASGRFQDVTAEARPQQESMVVTFRLKPYFIIKDITVSGEYPLFTQDILKVMTVYVGDYIHPGMAAEQKSLIEQFLVTEGYIEPVVDVSVRPDGEDGTATVEVNLIKDRYYTLRSFVIKGNRNVSENRIKLRTSTWKRSFLIGSSSRFREKTLTDDVKDLTEFYRGIGYPEAEVAYSLDMDPEREDAEVTIRIQEGPKYRVSFSGNEEFFAFTLKKSLVLFSDGNRRGSGLRKSIRNLRELYHNNGYPNVTIKAEETMEGSGGREVKKVAFVISEGPQAVVSDITFKGNTAFDAEDLRSRMNVWKKTLPLFGKRLFVRDLLDQDIQEIRTLYKQNGFARADVREELAWEEGGKLVAVTVAVSEGVQTIVSSIGFEGITSISPDKARACIGIREGEPFSETGVQDNSNALASCISEQGYPHVKVRETVTVSPDRKKANIHYAVNEGPFVRMGRTYFSGNFKTRRRVLQRELDMDPGDPFSLSKIVEGQNSIRDMGIFNSVRFRSLGLREGLDEVTVLADVQEKKPYYAQASLGYESNVGLYGNARAGDRNVFGLNKELWASAEASQTGERYDLTINEPRIFGTRIAGLYNVFLEKQDEFNQDFELTTIGTNLGFIKRHGRRVLTSLNFRYERRERSLQDSETGDAIVVEDESIFDPRSVITVTPGITYDSRNSFVRPQKGVYSSFSVDFTNGLQESLDDFIRYRLDVRTYLSPFENLTFAWLVRAGFVNPAGSTMQVPDDQLFYLGGTLDVRGYDENMLLYDAEDNPIGGRQSLAGSIEARYLLAYNLELALFYDIGSLRKTSGEPVTDSTRSSYGTGLRYVTPIGPIGLLYGRKIDPGPEESPDRWHFSIGYTF